MLAEEGPGVLAAMLVVVELVVWVLEASQFDSDSVQEVDCIYVNNLVKTDCLCTSSQLSYVHS